MADIVLNHRLGADAQEEVLAVQDAGNNRNQTVADPRTIQAWTKFTFPGRKGKYSDFTWNWSHFDGTDWDKMCIRDRSFFVETKWEAAGKSGKEDMKSSLNRREFRELQWDKSKRSRCGGLPFLFKKRQE